MIARFFITAALLVSALILYTGESPMEFFSKEAPLISQDQWASVLPGRWKDEETGGIAIIEADGSYRQEGRERVIEPIENSPFKGTVLLDLFAKTRGNWRLKEDKLTFTILSLDHFIVHDYKIESPEFVQKQGAEVLKKIESQARQQLESEMRAKFKNMTITHTITSVQRDRIVSRDPKGKESIARRIK